MEDRKNINDFMEKTNIEIENLNKKIKDLSIIINKKEDDIKNIINEKDYIIMKMNNQLIEYKNQITQNKNEIEKLHKKIKNISSLNKKMNDEINLLKGNIYNSINMNLLIEEEQKGKKTTFLNYNKKDINKDDIEIFINYKKIKIINEEDKFSWIFPTEGIYTIIIIFHKKLTTCYEMFWGINIININLSNFDDSQIGSCCKMFCQCNKLKKLNFGLLHFSKSNNFDSMFFGCENLTELNVSYFNTKNSISFSSMFRGCSKLTEINVSNFNSSKCENIHAMFEGCENITEIDLLNWDMSNIKVVENNQFSGVGMLFENCKNLNYIKMNINFKDIKNLFDNRVIKIGKDQRFIDNPNVVKIIDPCVFTNIAEKGTFEYKIDKYDEKYEDIFKLLPKNWNRKKYGETICIIF